MLGLPLLSVFSPSETSVMRKIGNVQVKKNVEWCLKTSIQDLNTCGKAITPALNNRSSQFQYSIASETVYSIWKTTRLTLTYKKDYQSPGNLTTCFPFTLSIKSKILKSEANDSLIKIKSSRTALPPIDNGCIVLDIQPNYR